MIKVFAIASSTLLLVDAKQVSSLLKLNISEVYWWNEKPVCILYYGA